LIFTGEPYPSIALAAVAVLPAALKEANMEKVARVKRIKQRVGDAGVMKVMRKEGRR